MVRPRPLRGRRLGAVLLVLVITLLLPDGARAQLPAQIGANDDATLTVTSAADPGDGTCDATCTLRDALNAANADPAPNRIVFAIGAGPATIRLTAPLPALDDPATTIDGSTQPGYQGRPLIYLDGSGLQDASGLVSRAPGVEFRALAVGGFDRFGFLAIGEEADDNRFLGNWAGLTPDGAAAAPNALSGIAVVAGADNALIGDTCSRCGNRLAGNSVPARTGHGVLVGGVGTTGARVRANVIGLGLGGQLLPNDDGVLIVDGAHATVGGRLPGEGNIVAASRVAGIELRATSALLSLRVEGNRVGLDEGGRPAPNDVGIFLNDAARNVEIGGALPGAGNVVAANRVGIAIEDRARDIRLRGNRVGLDPLGRPVPNTEDGVSIIAGARNVDVGGPTAGDQNWIVGGANGLTIADPATTNVRLLGNVFGRTPGGLPAGSDVAIHVSAGSRIVIGRAGSGNTIVAATQAGILLHGAAQITIAGNHIGLLPDDTPLGNAVGLLLRDGARDNTIEDNRIGGNTGPGIEILGDASVRNRLTGNVFLPNGGLAIDLGGDGPTPNDPADVDAGPNRLLNAPVIDSLTHEARIDNGGSARISGTATPRIRVELYRVGADDLPGLLPHPSGHGPGVEFIGLVRAGADGAWSARRQIPPGSPVTAVAVDSFGNTSEFARNFVPDPPVFLQPGFTPAGWFATATPIDAALAPLGDRLLVAFRFNPVGQTWQTYRPGLPFLSSIDTLQPGDALWVLLTPGPRLLWPQPPHLVGDRLLRLQPGLNFTTWTGPLTPLPDALATIAASLRAAFRWDPTAERFQTVFPLLPGLNPAPLAPGDVLWLRLTAPADWLQPAPAPPPEPDDPPELDNPPESGESSQLDDPTALTLP